MCQQKQPQLFILDQEKQEMAQITYTWTQSAQQLLMDHWCKYPEFGVLGQWCSSWRVQVLVSAVHYQGQTLKQRTCTSLIGRKLQQADATCDMCNVQRPTTSAYLLSCSEESAHDKSVIP